MVRDIPVLDDVLLSNLSRYGIDLELDLFAISLVRLDLPVAIVELDLGNRLPALVLDHLDNLGERLGVRRWQLVGKPVRARSGGGEGDRQDCRGKETFVHGATPRCEQSR